ncbi:MAG: hypothetical protein V3W19_06295 [Desulfatiglandales bacterium]
MTSVPTDQELENKRLAMKYRPLLVLFPEIEDGSEREDHHHPEFSIGSKPPLDYDYHPRDIYLVLDNARIPPKGLRKLLCLVGIRGKRQTTDKLLEEMGNNKIEHIDLIDEKGPKEVGKFWRTYANIRDRDTRYPRKVYARVVRGSSKFKDYTSIQYWMAYFFDDWANVHEMDWEMVSVLLQKKGEEDKPVACIYNAHLASFRKKWEDVWKADENKVRDDNKGLHPVAFIANGSHAAYFHDYPLSFNVAEKYVKPMLKTVVRLMSVAGGSPVAYFIDYVPPFPKDDSDEAEKHFPEIEAIPEPDERGLWSGKWSWLNFTGNWGSPAELTPKQLLFQRIPIVNWLFKLKDIFKRPIRGSGPTGPNARLGACWNEPFDWINTECLKAEDEEERNWIAQISEKRTNNA